MGRVRRTEKEHEHAERLIAEGRNQPSGLYRRTLYVIYHRLQAAKRTELERRA